MLRVSFKTRFPLLLLYSVMETHQLKLNYCSFLTNTVLLENIFYPSIIHKSLKMGKKFNSFIEHMICINTKLEFI